MSRLDDWIVRQFCSVFGHDLVVPQWPTPFAPIICRRCNWTLLDEPAAGKGSE